MEGAKVKVTIDILDFNEEKTKLLELLAKESNLVLSQAYLYAKNLGLYGVNVAESWDTVVQQSANLEKAYMRGYYDAMERMKDGKDNN